MRIIRYCNVEAATKKELAAYTGHDLQVIGKIVNDMVEMGVLLETGKLKTTGIRPAQLYEYNSDFKW